MAFEAGSGRGVCRVYTRCRAYRPTTAPVRRRVSALVQGPASLMRALDTCTYTFTLSTLSHTCTYSCALFEPLCWDFSLGTPKAPPVGASWLVRHRVLEAVRSAPSWPAWAPVLFLGAAPAPRTFYHYAAATTAVEMQDDGRALSIIVGNTGGGEARRQEEGWSVAVGESASPVAPWRRSHAMPCYARSSDTANRVGEGRQHSRCERRLESGCGMCITGPLRLESARRCTLVPCKALALAATQPSPGCLAPRVGFARERGQEGEGEGEGEGRRQRLWMAPTVSSRPCSVASCSLRLALDDGMRRLRRLKTIACYRYAHPRASTANDRIFSRVSVLQGVP